MKLDLLLSWKKSSMRETEELLSIRPRSTKKRRTTSRESQRQRRKRRKQNLEEPSYSSLSRKREPIGSWRKITCVTNRLNLRTLSHVLSKVRRT